MVIARSKNKGKHRADFYLNETGSDDLRAEVVTRE